MQCLIISQIRFSSCAPFHWRPSDLDLHFATILNIGLLKVSNEYWRSFIKFTRFILNMLFLLNTYWYNSEWLSIRRLWVWAQASAQPTFFPQLDTNLPWMDSSVFGQAASCLDILLCGVLMCESQETPTAVIWSSNCWKRC